MGKKSREKKLFGNRRKSNLEQPPPAVIDIFLGRTPALVAITTVGISGTETATQSRSMGFIVEIGTDYMLVVTCKHALSNFNAPGYKTIVAYKNPTITELNCDRKPIHDPLAESDVSFLLVRGTHPTQTPVFDITCSSLLLPHETTLYNARNTCKPFHGLFGIDGTRQHVSERSMTIFKKYSEKTTWHVPCGDTNKTQKLLADGWIPHRAFTMVSRPGYSGSPIWDDNLNLYGMDTGGSEPGNMVYKKLGDVTVCLGVAEIFAARRRIEELLQIQTARKKP